jgi:hypothetical protein
MHKHVTNLDRLISLEQVERNIRMQTSEQDGKRIHFVPGQISFFAKHRPSLQPEMAVRLLIEQVSRVDTAQRIDFSSARIQTFSDEREILEFVFANVPTVRDETEILNLIDELNNQFQSEHYPSQQPVDAHVEHSLQAITTNLSERHISFTATPNWLLNSAPPEHNGSGGPGSRPVRPAPGSLSSSLSGGIDFWDFRLPDIFTSTITSLPRDQWGQDVDVFILDTVPDETDMKRAFTRWQDTNPLIKSLLGPHSPLDITYAGKTHLLQAVNAFLPDHDYVMSDHGLFVAGIIHTIAPQARLHLIEVLNPFGVGSLESIINGFHLVATQAAGKPRVVVNCSLFLDVVQEDKEWIKRLSERDHFWAEYPFDQISKTVAPLKEVCDFLERQRADVIAAAGNDGKDNFHPLPRFPAAFPSVFGVGALLSDNQNAATYSNISDAPDYVGITTIGGETDPTGKFADQSHGIIGVYTGVFPDGAPNDSGWARWAGTSFATPIISGVIAALISNGHPNPEQALRDAFQGPPNSSQVGEIFPVTQG